MLRDPRAEGPGEGGQAGALRRLHNREIMSLGYAHLIVMLPSARARPRTKSGGKNNTLNIKLLCARSAQQNTRPAAGDCLIFEKQFLPLKCFPNKNKVNSITIFRPPAGSRQTFFFREFFREFREFWV